MPNSKAAAAPSAARRPWSPPRARAAAFVLLAASILSSLAACGSCSMEPKSGAAIQIMSYNLMTFFDPVDHGGEYEDFKAAAGWNEEAYRRRLKNAASAIRGALPGGPDLLALQEIENERALNDLAEELGGYPYALMAKDRSAVLSSALLSRYPALAVRAHKALPPPGGPASAPREILEAEIDLGGTTLILFVCHWKSKLGGAAETEAERRGAAALLNALVAARLAAEPGAAVVIAGDLNENPDEYERVARAYPTALMPAETGPGPWLLLAAEPEGASAAGPVYFSPWPAETEGYSYLYQDERERIDHFLLSAGAARGGAIRFEGFDAAPPAFLVDERGRPLAWSTRSGSGYSDHLPIRLTLKRLP